MDSSSNNPSWLRVFDRSSRKPSCDLLYHPLKEIAQAWKHIFRKLSSSGFIGEDFIFSHLFKLNIAMATNNFTYFEMSRARHKTF